MAIEPATSRAAARKAGARFYVGTECSSHPDALRYTSNARCVECAKADRRLTYASPAAKAKDAERKRMARKASLASLEAFADLLG